MTMVVLESVKKGPTRIVVASPVCQKATILKEFLISLDGLDLKNIILEYLFVDDNEDEGSKELLRDFASEHTGATVLQTDAVSRYVSDDFTHRWTEETVQKVARFKNHMIEVAIDKEYDYLFFIDSDVILHPKTLQQLISDQKDIISNIFWTKWGPNMQELPQVWLKDAYTLYDAKTNGLTTQDDINKATQEFLELLRKPGVYRVGGLGACTLISRKALLKGVNFNDVYNISFWGEDRHFCIRAVALGLELFVDTYYPAYHIYRTEDLAGVEGYRANYDRRETEIIGAKLLDIVVDAVNNLNTFSYETPIQDGFRKHFTKEEGDMQFLKLQEARSRVEKQQIINKCNVMQCTMAFSNFNKCVSAQVKYCNNGYKKGYSYYEEFDSICELREQSNGQYLITGFETKSKLPLEGIPLIRKVITPPKMTLSMIVKNEEGRYLERVLQAAKGYIDNAVILDDGSTDKTIQICRDILGDKLTLIENKKSQFDNETIIRKQQWFETISTNPDWMLFLDADEIFEDRAQDIMPQLIQNKDVDGYIFRLYDFWDEEHYRQDQLWCAHHTFRPFLIRYQRNFNYTFTETPQHCGRMPSNAMSLPCLRSDLRLKHYGWATEMDRLKKYKRYMKLDPEGKYGSMPQYQSILDANPQLVKWNEFHINS